MQFVIATLHVAVCLQQAINGFIRSPDPAFYFSPEGDTGVPLQTAELSLYVTNVSVATFVVSRTEVNQLVFVESYSGRYFGTCTLGRVKGRDTEV